MNIYFNTLLIFGSLSHFVYFVLQVDKRKQCADSCWLRSLAGQKTTRIINRQQPAKLQPTTNNNNIDFYIRNAFLKANKGNALHANIAASSLEATSHSYTHTNTPHTLHHTTHIHTHNLTDSLKYLKQQQKTNKQQQPP